MVGEIATRYRAMVARCNSRGCDRPDVQVAAKEASRWMVKPSQNDEDNIIKLSKYLHGSARRKEQVFPLGKDDSWAGCRRTSKSTSGGVLRQGDV